MAVQERHAIKMPGSLLDQIKDKEEKGDYNGDKKYASEKKTKKRKAKEMGRKEKRKEMKLLKKQKKINHSQKKNSNKQVKLKSAPVKQEEDSFSSDEGEDTDQEISMTEDDTWAALKALKAGKSNKANIVEKQVEESSDEEIEEDDFSGFSEDEEFEDEEPQTVEETMAALKALKEKKQKDAEKPAKSKEMTPMETMLALKALKLKKTSKESKKTEKIKTVTPKTSLMREDEAQIDYYAKKLGINKKDKLKDVGDGLDSILDGLDFDFGSEGEEVEDYEGDNVSDEEMYSDEMDDSLDSITEPSLGDDDDEFDDDSERGPKENPYVAPVQTSKYIPPAMRRKMLEESANAEGESEEVKKIKKLINSALNKLSEANFISVVSNELNPIYNDHPRQTVTEVLTKYTLSNTLSSSRLLDSFIIVYAGLVNAIYRLQGVEFAAYFIQKFVETLQDFINRAENSTGKELNNLISLFGFVYNLSVFSSNLIFDIINLLCVDMNITKIDTLLRLVTISGPKMRHEDPSSLKEIISLATKSINGELSLSLNTRAKFLLETLQNLKNNKVKNSDQMENNTKVLSSLKKQLLNLSKAAHDPIQVTLDDIKNIDTKGKWWLVGSAWKGSDDSKRTEVNNDVMNDILDSAEPNWNELADYYRMNTSIRKAIFIAIMSSDGFEEATTKIHKLALKGHQKFDIPKIVLLCCSIEPHYNPFYGYVAKECCSDHDMRKTFQFNLWDLIKEFEGAEDDDSDSDDEGGLGKLTSVGENDEETKLRKILSLGKLYGFLIGQKSLPLTVLKTVNFVTATQDTKLFMEILLVTFLDNVGKLSELAQFGAGKKKSKIEDMKFDDKKLIERLPKGQSVLLRGIQYFLQQNVRASEFISGRRQTKRVEWGCDTLCDVIDDFLNEDEQD